MDESSEPPTRKRKTHTKSRTGCLTCKIRRKKCDERRPYCTQCVSTGRKCDGYAQPAHKPMGVELGAPCMYGRDIVGVPASLDGCERLVPGISFAERFVWSAEYWGMEVQESHFPVQLPDVTGFVYDTRDARSRGDGVQLFKSNLDGGPSAPEFFPDTKTYLEYGGKTDAFRNTDHSERSEFARANKKCRRSNYTSATHSNMLTIPQGLDSFTLDPTLNEVDKQCFTYFCNSTGPQLSGYFDCSIFGKYTISRALTDPILFTAAAALGAVHRRYNYGISREAFEYCEYAKSLHGRALRQLGRLKSQLEYREGSDVGPFRPEASTYDKDIVVVAEILMSAFAAFQAEYSTVVDHITNALQNVLGRRIAISHKDITFCPYLSEPEAIRRFIRQIGLRMIQLFGSPANILAKWAIDNRLPPMPSKFSSIVEARDFIYTEVEWILNIPQARLLDDSWRAEMQDFHVRRILEWNMAYAETMRALPRTDQEQQACFLLKLTRSLAYTLLWQTSTTLKDVNEELNWNFIRDNVLAGIMIVDRRSSEHSEDAIGFDSCIGPPSNGSPSIEASRKVRHLVKGMIKTRPVDPKQLKTKGVYNVGELMCAVEEHSVIKATKEIMTLEAIEPLRVDVACLLESRKVLLRYFTPHESGAGLVWTNEWWTFQ